MHPYQDQVNRMWEIIKLNGRARKNGFWLESLSLSYVLLEVELRLLLTSKAGKDSTPISPEKIENQQYLMQLANLAKDNKFLDEGTWLRIKEFNDVRRKAIHGLTRGKISYAELETPATQFIDLAYAIQSRWLKITIGKEETYEEYKVKQSK